MSKSLRWRVFVLQIGLIGIFAFGSGVAFWANGFIHGMIHDQLVAQKITFPAAGSKSLDPTEFADLQKFGGQSLDNGEKAQAYANGFIGRHLEKVADGKTYSEVSAEAQANKTDQKLAGQVQTLFRGETLRGLLLNAYGWWEVGTYAQYVAVGLMVAAFAVLVALLFEVMSALRERKRNAA